MSAFSSGVMRTFLHGAAIIGLTLVTQLGGLAWFGALWFRRRLLAFLFLYMALWISALFLAPLWGRVPYHCWKTGALEMQSWTYCVLNRNYFSPQLIAGLERTALRVQAQQPQTTTQLLDGSFPFAEGFPLLPHLSHDDGEKADIAFYYRSEGAYRAGFTPSPIGYFAFEDGPTNCVERGLSLRWDLAWLQPLWPEHSLDDARLKTLLNALAHEKVIGKILIEPHLSARLNVAHPKIRFQGCRAARHDDHIHVQL